MPMQYKYYFEIIYYILKDIRGFDVFFKKIPIIFGGDFSQILPIVRRINRARIVVVNLQ